MKKLTGLAALTLALCLAALGAFAQNGHANEAIRIGLMGPIDTYPNAAVSAYPRKNPRRIIVGNSPG